MEVYKQLLLAIVGIHCFIVVAVIFVLLLSETLDFSLSSTSVSLVLLTL